MENYFDKFHHLSREVVIESNLGEVVSIRGHFEDCFNQCYFVAIFHCGKNNVVFYFRRLDDAINFFKKYTKHYHSYKFMLSRLQPSHMCNYVIKLLYDDSINVNRLENPNRQKVLSYFASCCSMNFRIVSNGNNTYSLVPIIEKS